MYTDNQILRKTNIIYFILFIFVSTMLIFSDFSYATSDLKDMDNSINKQNEEIYEGIIENKTDGVNVLEEIFIESDRKNQQGGAAEIDLSSISEAVEINSIKLALWARKYIVPFTVLIMLFNVFMLATTAKNYKDRKKYIIGSIFLYVFFLIVLNFPLYLLWRYSLGVSAPFSFEGFYGFVEGVTDFLKEQSFVFSIIILSYGIVNYVGSQNNLPKRMASQFMIKTSFLMFVLFQIMPLILKLAI